MAFSKAKALQEAEKYVTQGKLSLAIQQYQRILEKDPADLTLLNTMGDLYVRDKNLPEALKQFHKLAESYSQEGFTVKSIAIYKKISKIDPNAVEVLVKAGDLYVLQGLAREARDQYAQAIEFYKKKKQTANAIEVFRKVVALDPSNPAFQGRLAEMCEQAGRKEDAARAYREAAELALRNGDSKTAEASLKKAASLDPENPEVQLLRARLALELQQPAEAEKILSALPNLKSDSRVQQILLESYLGTQKLEQAEQLVEEMVRANPQNFAPLDSYTTLCLAQGNYDAAAKPLTELADALLEAKQSGPLMQALRQISENNPRHLPSLELMYTICTKTGDEVRLVEVLEGLGHACVQSGNLERAQWAFQTLAEREPENQSYKMLLKQVLRKEGKVVEAEAAELAQEEIALAPEGSLGAAAAELSEQEAERVKAAFENSDLYSQYGLTEKAVGELEKVLADYPDQVDIHRRILEICLKDAPDRARKAAEELARIYAARGDAATAERYRETASSGAPPPIYESPAALAPSAPALVEEEATASPPPAAGPAEAPEFDLSAQFPGGAPQAPSPEPREIPLDLTAPASEQAEAPPAMEFDLSSALGGAPAPPEAPVEETVAPPAPEFDLAAAQEAPAEAVEAPPEQPEALPSLPGAPPFEAGAAQFNAEDSRIEVDFYLDQGFVDEARNVVQGLEEKFPGNPQVEALRRRIEERDAAPKEAVAEPSAPAEEPPAPPRVEEAAPSFPEPVSAAEAPVAPEAEVPPEPTPAPVEAAIPVAPQIAAPPPEPAPAAAGGDLLGGLVGELEASLEGLEAPGGATPQPQAPPSAGSPAPVSAAPSPFGNLLEELGEGDQAAPAEDPQTHYDLGVAFREMSLLDEAIGEFQKVVRGAQKGPYPPNFLQACTLLATCFMDKQMPAIAAKWYIRALETPNLDDEATLALHYDLGVAYEQAGDSRTALERFSEVYSQNIDYRDVAEKIRLLRQKS
jgi:tetratricopeptide (TPR) repeat protein